MAKQNPEQKEIVGRVMHEFKHGELELGKDGKVRNPKQAIAIALSEAGASNEQSPAENSRKLKQTEAKERKGKTARARKGSASKREADSTTRAELYRRAQAAKIPGRSRMDVNGLRHALESRGLQPR